METNLTDFKRIFTLASLGISILNIIYLSKRSTIDLTEMMFLISNYMTMMGFKLKPKYEDNKSLVIIFKFFDYGIILFFFITMMDTSFPLLPQNIWKIVVIFALILTATYYVIVSFLVMNNEEIKKLIEESTKKFAQTFDDQINQISQGIDDMGGWSEFVKTDVGRQWITAIKDASKPKTPRDHKRSKKKGR